MKNNIKKAQRPYWLIVVVLLSGTRLGFAQDNPVKDMLVKLLASNSTPDWEHVHSEFKKKYSGSTVDSLTSYTKMQYFNEKKDRKKYTALLIDYGKSYGKAWTADELNSYAWMLFKYGDQPQELQTALKWSKQSLFGEETKNNPIFLNTYANILYKLGNKTKALQYEWKVYSLFSASKPYMESKTGKIKYGLNKKRVITTLFNMEKGDPTWPVSKEEAAKYIETTRDHAKYWQKVKKNWLRREFPPRTADSLLYLAQLYYYDQKENKVAYMKLFIEYAEKYGNTTISEKNANAWEVFLRSKNLNHLKKALGWSVETIRDEEDKNFYAYLNTYANLLYKLGDKSKAMEYEKKALINAPEEQGASFHNTLIKMKKNQKTWD
ncbi:hypothetical protein [Sinomicrobium weinanense]|uniref:Tetratricopeptide repeat protein n=1 Tax=Sinomicrobium weinanense TaxID=2842200 RepID=A0A926JUU0_9FLAO|nr:hypothetical protein [Sinomicrobium weinanense]MBC9797714.1 hypothetical protein [Sinomicrobium weinanense]MBU3122260.1 hypothetical protein [Sinomicrobium weinanense]